jgi:hypothetical protein
MSNLVKIWFYLSFGVSRANRWDELGEMTRMKRRDTLVTAAVHNSRCDDDFEAISSTYLGHLAAG